MNNYSRTKLIDKLHCSKRSHAKHNSHKLQPGSIHQVLPKCIEYCYNHSYELVKKMKNQKPETSNQQPGTSLSNPH